MGEAEAGDSQLGYEQIEKPRDSDRSQPLSVPHCTVLYFSKNFKIVVLESRRWSDKSEIYQHWVVTWTWPFFSNRTGRIDGSSSTGSNKFQTPDSISGSLSPS